MFLCSSPLSWEKKIKFIVEFSIAVLEFQVILSEKIIGKTIKEIHKIKKKIIDEGYNSKESNSPEIVIYLNNIDTILSHLGDYAM